MFISVLKKVLIIILIVLNIIVFFPYKSLAVETAENQYIWEIAKLLYDYLRIGTEGREIGCNAVIYGVIVNYDIERETSYGEDYYEMVPGKKIICDSEFSFSSCYETPCYAN